MEKEFGIRKGSKEMIIDMSKLSMEELIEINRKAIAQISKLVEENNKLKEKLRSESERT